MKTYQNVLQTNNLNNVNRFKCGLSIIALCMISNGLYAESTIKQLEAITVNILNTSESEISKNKLEKTVGSVNFIAEDQLENSRLATNEDLFKYQTGIYAKSSGNEGVKISIRGSGINRAPGAHASGLYVLLDDIPFTGPGGTPYELLEPSWLNYIEVYRGANGFDKSSLSLGGAINYTSKTGNDADPLAINFELGSHGYQKYQVSTAQKNDNFDYYLSLNASSIEGYQDLTKGDSKGITGNIGIQIDPNLNTRFYFRYRETEHQTPGRLTKQQIKYSPTIANNYNIQNDTKRIQPGSTWLANKTTYDFDDGRNLQASFAYHRYPMDLQESPYRTDVNYSDITAQLKYVYPYDFIGMDSILQITGRTTIHRPDSGVNESLRFNLNGYEAGTLTRKYTYRGADNIITINNESEIFDGFWLLSAIAGIYTHRESEVYYPITNEKVDLKEFNIAPRLGLRYQFNPELQIFANLSRSVEPAHPWSMIWSSYKYFDQNSGAASGRQSIPVPLQHQTANTFEIGARGEHENGEWDLSYYYSKVKNELLGVEISPAPNLIVSESNASPTIHQGVELGLSQLLYNFDHYADLKLIQAYTYSDFRYKNDHHFGSNQLAGIPKHFYQARISLDFYNGFYASINTEYASKIAVDFANSFFADAYQIWGASLGYRDLNDKWNTWLDFKNIANKKYAATVTPGYNDLGNDVARSSPGEGFSTYFGLSFRFK